MKLKIFLDSLSQHRNYIYVCSKRDITILRRLTAPFTIIMGCEDQILIIIKDVPHRNSKAADFKVV